MAIYTKGGLKIRLDKKKLDQVLSKTSLPTSWSTAILSKTFEDCETWTSLPAMVSNVSAIVLALSTRSWVTTLLGSLLVFLLLSLLQSLFYSGFLKNLIPALGIGSPIASVVVGFYLWSHGAVGAGIVQFVVVLANWLSLFDLLLLILLPIAWCLPFVKKLLRKYLGLYKNEDFFREGVLGGSELAFVHILTDNVRRDVGVELDWEAYDPPEHINSSTLFSGEQVSSDLDDQFRQAAEQISSDLDEFRQVVGNVEIKRNVEIKPDQNIAASIKPLVLRRLFARLIDYLLVSTALIVLLPLYFPYFRLSIPEGAMLAWITYFQCVFIESWFLSRHGTTPGKWLFKITVQKKTGGNLSYSEALRRSLSIWIRGLGFGLPGVNIITALWAIIKLKADETETTWDRNGGFVVRHSNSPSGFLRGLLICIVSAWIGLGILDVPTYNSVINKIKEVRLKEDYETALREYRRLAEEGHAAAQFNLGLMYRKGEGVPPNDETAVKWYTLAAEQGFARAQFKMGWMCLEGYGVPQDYQTAVKWFILAAEQGHADAQFNLGLMYGRGEGVDQDYKTAVKWFILAAEQGHAEGQYGLGLRYDTGKGVPRDYQTAVKWYRLAAEQRYASAQNNLGVMYYKGQGVPKNYQTAVKWYRLAAEQGYAGAQYNLALMYAKGEGVLQDFVYAHMWFNVAASQGTENAVKARDLATELMTPSQIERAQDLAGECVEKKFKDCD